MSKKVQGPQYYLSRINTKVMNYEVYELSTTEKLLYRLGLFIAGGLVGLIFYGGLFKSNGEATLLTHISDSIVFVLVGLLANKAFIETIIGSLKKKRIDELKKQFCNFTSAFANALSSGMNVNDSLYAVHRDLQDQYSDDAYIVQEVKEIINGINNGCDVEVMLEDFGARSGVQDISNFAIVFATCYRKGGDIKNVVKRTTEIISEKVVISSEIDTAMTSNKMQMNIMNFLPIVIVFMMRMMSPSFAESFSSVIGVIGLTFSAGLTIGAYKLGQKIMDIKG